MNLNMDEKIIMNSMVLKQNVSEINLESLKESVVFAIEVADAEMKQLLEGVFEKLSSVNVDDFNDIKMRLPFDVDYDFESNVDNVPIDEHFS